MDANPVPDPVPAANHNGRPRIGHDGYLERVFAAFEEGHITEDEWKRADRAHRFVVAAAERAR